MFRLLQVICMIYVEKQPAACKEYCVEYCKKKSLRDSTDRCTGRRDITETMLKTTLINKDYTIDQSIHQTKILKINFISDRTSGR